MIALLKKYWREAALVLLVCMFAGREYYRPSLPPQEFYGPVQPSSDIEGIKPESVPVKSVQVLPKDKLAKKLETVPAVLNNPAMEATTMVIIPPHDGDTEVIPVLDTGTGAVHVEARRLPRDWFEFKNEWEIGPTYSLWAQDASTTDRIGIMAMWSPLRVGSMHVHLIGQLHRDEQRAEVWLGWRPR